MLTRLALILQILLLFSSPASQALAEEDLFDTKAAAMYREQGLSALKHKNYDAAIAAFEELVAALPDAEAYYLLGYAYYLKGKKTGDQESRESAAENFGQVYQIDPRFSPSRFKNGELNVPAEGEGGEPDTEADQESKPTATPPGKKPMSEPTTTTEKVMSEPTMTMEKQ